jgi:AcrR family transcriptional regulator
MILERAFQVGYLTSMARPKAFDIDLALDDAISVFREHGYEGASAEMLVRAMGIGRQSLYDTFGDKWGLYCAAVRRYAQAETRAHLQALRSELRASDGLAAMVTRVVAQASTPCLGVNSICEFGRSRPELTDIHAAARTVLHAAISERVQEAQADGDLAPDLAPEETADFLSASFAGIRIAARGGAAPSRLEGLGALAMRALR